MNVREAILEERSKAQSLRIAHFIGNDEQRFADLMHLFLNDEYRVCQRAAWVVGILSEKYPHLIEPYLETMLLNLEKPVHNAVKRNTVRILNDLNIIPEHLLGLTATICFNFISTPSVAVAIKAFSMRILFKICLVEPDLKNELQLIIEDMLPHESAAFVSTGKDVLKKLKKLA